MSLVSFKTKPDYSFGMRPALVGAGRPPASGLGVLFSGELDGSKSHPDLTKAGPAPAATPENIAETTLNLTPLVNAAQELRRLLEPFQAEPGVVDEVMRHLLGGSARLPELLSAGIKTFQQNLPKSRSLTLKRDPQTQAVIGMEITSGSKTSVLGKRLNVFHGEQMTFQQFLKHPAVLGDDKKLLISVSGWTIPPCHYLMNHPDLNEALSNLDSDAERMAFSERFYVEAVKDYLNDVLKRLKKDNPNVTDDLAFVYGVSDKGVDRAVEAFCQENRIKLVGVTCFDWAEDIPDQAGKPPVLLVSNPFAFRKIFLEETDQLVVMGGRHYAAPVKEQPSLKTSARNPVMPVDILAMHGVKVPPVVLSDLDKSTYTVENAAALLKSSEESNPAFYPEVAGAMNAENDAHEVFALHQILKRRLERFDVLKKALKK